jgi:energy-coupling factor transporter ATP-binding protein EcfA2
VIHVEDLVYTYPRGRQPALRGVSLAVPAGQFCALVGANGAGKSTLCNALAGFVPHFYRGTLKGRVEVAGLNVAETGLADLAGVVGLVFANPFNQISGARFTVRDEVAFGLENLGVERAEMVARVEETLALAGLSELAGRSPYALSGGQQQRLAIASVLAMRPQLLILDEPTSQLDPVSTRQLFELLSELAAPGKMTVVVATHSLEWVAACAERVVVLAGGQIVADGRPLEVLASPLLAEHGLGQTRYTEVARLAQEQGLAPAGRPLPVTLEQAVEFLR